MKKTQKEKKMQKIHIKKKDTVQVIAGKDKGKRGKVLSILPGNNRVVVEKVNMVYKHKKPTKTNQKGGILDMEGSIHVSNVMVVCGSCNHAVRVKYSLMGDGTKSRVCTNCNALIDK